VALAYLNDEVAMVAAARSLSELTHFDPQAGEACVLWCCAIRHAVLTGEIDVRVGLGHLAPDRRAAWEDHILRAESAVPADFEKNGFVVQALQGAWSAIHGTPEPEDDPARRIFRADRLRLALEAAVRGGRDADTVAAIAGGLLGAAYGASAVPLHWRAMLKGWPNATSRTLVQLASAIERQGAPDGFDYGYPGSPVDTLARHPYDPQVVLGGVGVLRNLPDDVDAVVSMCRLRDEDIRTDMPHLEVRLIDRPEHDENPHLDYVLLDAVRAIERLRAQGRTVLVHCVGALSRTPTMGTLYGLRLREVSAEQALTDVITVLPGAHPNRAFRAALNRAELWPGAEAEGR
jgi:protein-tyrosine phosphatase